MSKNTDLGVHVADLGVQVADLAVQVHRFTQYL